MQYDVERASPEKLEVGNGFGVVAHGIAELDHGLTEVWEAVRVDFQLAGLHIVKDSQASVDHARHQVLPRPSDQPPNVINDSQYSSQGDGIVAKNTEKSYERCLTGAGERSTKDRTLAS